MTEVYSLTDEGFRVRGTLVSLVEMPLTVLRTLERNSGKIVRMDEFRAALRPKYNGSDANIRNSISTLRRMLYPHGASDWIHTIKNTGYRFLPPVAREAKSVPVGPVVERSVEPVEEPPTVTALGAAIKSAIVEPGPESDGKKEVVVPSQYGWHPGRASGVPQSPKALKKWNQRKAAERRAAE